MGLRTTVKDTGVAEMVFALIEKRREMMNYSAGEMADMLGIGRGQYWNLRRGKSRMSIDQMAKALSFVGFTFIIADKDRVDDREVSKTIMINKGGVLPPINVCGRD